RGREALSRDSRAVGALAAGPVGAAVGAVANAVLDKPMSGIGAKTYRITGPWAAPKVEVVAKHPAPATVPSAEGD
ncbi:MAG TPA: AsmA-like C-terminal region-containing protein, partial [Thermomonas sp.]|nr:AsmA-like C-terminal region-containing protein [Thermomonas sp.]